MFGTFQCVFLFYVLIPLMYTFFWQDEVLMESDKVPFLLEDLISLLTDTMEWTAGSSPLTHKLAPLPDKALSMLNIFAANNKGLDMNDIHKERKVIGQCKVVFSSDFETA